MSRWDKVSDERKKAIFRYNAAKAADSAAAADMRKIAEAISRLPLGQLKKLLGAEIREILSRYGAEV